MRGGGRGCWGVDVEGVGRGGFGGRVAWEEEEEKMEMLGKEEERGWGGRRGMGFSVVYWQWFSV